MDSRTEEARAAEELLFKELRDRGESRGLDLEGLCAANPKLADALRRAHADWNWVTNLGMNPRGDPPLGQGDRRPSLGREKYSGRYSLLGKIAEGGMGKVYRAWDSHLKRVLAMKVSAARHIVADDGKPSAPSRAVYRFLEEAEIMGQLNHPGVVPVHDLGVDAEGRVFFTMDLVQGLDLEHLLEKVHTGNEEWNSLRVVGVLARVCETLGYAHQKGVIHRDIKPANIMVGRFGQTYVMDWGLARVVPEEDIQADWAVETKRFVSERQARGELSPSLNLLTRSGSILGTPAYMAPEQASGKQRGVGRHSDIYAVGAMLYHLLSGKPPYGDLAHAESDSQVTIEALNRSPPTPLCVIAPRAPQVLVAITEMAMARQVADRYPDMTALGEDLRAFLENRVVQAHRTGFVAELRLLARRNPVAAGAVLLALLLLLAMSLT